MSQNEKLDLMPALVRVRDGKLTLPESRSEVQKAGPSRRPEYIGVLKEIAAKLASGANHLVVFDALDALSSLGESREYFLHLAQDYGSSEMAAYYAILILAREPDRRVLDVLERVQQACSNNQVRGAVDLAKFVAYRDQLVNAEPDLEKKAELLIEGLKTGWNPIRVEEYSPTGNLNPVAVWSQRRIRALSEEHPREVAQAVARIGPSTDVGSEWQNFQAYVRRFTK